MNKFLNRFATPLTTGLFAVSAVSGTALFFHWSQGTFHEMHEWLSMLLLLPFALHIWKNWAGLVGYARRKSLWVPLIACLVIALPFSIGGMTEKGRGGNPAFGAIALLTQARLADVAPVLKTTPDALLTTLKQHGYKAESADQTLDEIAAASGEPANRLLFGVMPGH